MHVQEETLKDKKKREKAKKVDRAIWHSEIKELCSTRVGRKFIWKILEQCKFQENVADVKREVTERNIGKQSVAHWIKAQLDEVDIKILFKMMTENSKGDYNNE